MKFGIFFATVGRLARPENLVHLAQTAERVGFESIWSVEHVVVPVHYDSRYPYDPGGRLPIPPTDAIPDPLLPLAYAAARTTRLRFGTGVIILPQHHPLYLAKQAATLDLLSGGRLMLGVGLGWLKEESDALGIPFAERAARAEETIQAMRSLWKEEPEPFSGRFFRWGPVASHPKPVQRGGVPILIAGHVDNAARRAARYGDGFFPGALSAERLGELMAILREECGRVGRDPSQIEVTAAIGGRNHELFRQWEEHGVSRLVIADPLGESREEVERTLEIFAEQVIRKY